MQLERPAIKRVRNMVARHATRELQFLVREATEVCRSYRSSAVPVELSRHLPEGLNPTARVLIGRLGGVPAPAPAEARGIGPGLAFGLAAGALVAGAAAANAYPYYGPGYYYGPSYYYGPGPYAYYGGPVYYPRRHYYRHYRHW